jgi:hypothetical protein
VRPYFRVRPTIICNALDTLSSRRRRGSNANGVPVVQSIAKAASTPDGFSSPRPHCQVLSADHLLIGVHEVEGQYNPHPGDMKCPMWWNAHLVPAHLRHRHSQSTYWMLPESSRNDNHLVSCSISCFKNNSKVLEWRITRWHILLENPLFTVTTPRSSTKTTWMDRKDTVASFSLPRYLYWSFISSWLWYPRNYQFCWNSWQQKGT